MKTEAFATVVGNSLLCTLTGTDWHFFIRRLNGEVYVPFSKFHKKTISPTDVVQYLPNWKTLRWTRIKDSILGKHESYAKDVEFEVNVYTTELSPKKHQEVVEAFLEFMHSV
ncbi:MAG: hypothetical protein PHN45_11330 [Methylococcales bacterium]|nr:hypothetical protein [Methylococcales bacterium]